MKLILPNTGWLSAEAPETPKDLLTFNLHNDSEYHLTEVTLEIQEYDTIVFENVERPEDLKWDLHWKPPVKSVTTVTKKYRQSVDIAPLSGKNIQFPDTGTVPSLEKSQGCFASANVAEAKGMTEDEFQRYRQAAAAWDQKYGSSGQASSTPTPSRDF